jgi:hypothetical protein
MGCSEIRRALSRFVTIITGRRVEIHAIRAMVLQALQVRFMRRKISSNPEAKALVLAEREQRARERGKAIPFYAAAVVRELASQRKHGKLTPSKRAPSRRSSR